MSWLTKFSKRSLISGVSAPSAVRIALFLLNRRRASDKTSEEAMKSSLLHNSLHSLQVTIMLLKSRTSTNGLRCSNTFSTTSIGRSLRLRAFSVKEVSKIITKYQDFKMPGLSLTAILGKSDFIWEIVIFLTPMWFRVDRTLNSHLTPSLHNHLRTWFWSLRYLKIKPPRLLIPYFS